MSRYYNMAVRICGFDQQRLYYLTIDGPAFRRQRELLQRLRGFAASDMSFRPGLDEVEMLEGLIELTDTLADQAHDVHGIDCLLDDGTVTP